MKLRSVLFVPGERPKALFKALTLPCDAVVFDLEDATSPNRKDEARDNVLQILSDISTKKVLKNQQSIIVRINCP